MDHFLSALNWLVFMHQTPGFQNHVWLRAMKLDQTELYAGMWQALQDRVGPAPSDAQAYRVRMLG